MAQYTAEKLIELGARAVTLSDSSGGIDDEQGIDRHKLECVMSLKNLRRGRIREHAEKYPEAVYTPLDADQGFNPLRDPKADCAFPSATQNEINGFDAQHLVANGVQLVSEGATITNL